MSELTHQLSMWFSFCYPLLNKILLFVSIIAIILCFCPTLPVNADASSSEYTTRSGKSIHVTETHPVGQSLSDVSIKTVGFEYNLEETLSDIDPIKDVHIADLDSNGFDEIYIITVSAGSGSYGNVIAYASNRDKSLSMINFPEIREGDERFTGYMGHDTFTIIINRLVRSFPIYLTADTGSRPTGGTRRVTYELIPGEAAWQLQINGFEDIR